MNTRFAKLSCSALTLIALFLSACVSSHKLMMEPVIEKPVSASRKFRAALDEPHSELSGFDSKGATSFSPDCHAFFVMFTGDHPGRPYMPIKILREELSVEDLQVVTKRLPVEAARYAAKLKRYKEEDDARNAARAKRLAEIQPYLDNPQEPLQSEPDLTGAAWDAAKNFVRVELVGETGGGYEAHTLDFGEKSRSYQNRYTQTKRFKGGVYVIKIWGQAGKGTSFVRKMYQVVECANPDGTWELVKITSLE